MKNFLQAGNAYRNLAWQCTSSCFINLTVYFLIILWLYWLIEAVTKRYRCLMSRSHRLREDDFHRSTTRGNQNVSYPWSPFRNIIVRTIGYMLKNTFADVRFNNRISDKWKINKGSRQGGILSPVLFNFYVKGCIEDIVAFKKRVVFIIQCVWFFRISSQEKCNSFSPSQWLLSLCAFQKREF